MQRMDRQSYMSHTYKMTAGVPLPLGATWNGSNTNFSLFSEHATAVELCLFDEAGERELARLRLPEFTDGVWHGCVEGLRPGTVYGYRVHGPYQPHNGHRFNANKLLLDPYATAHTGTLTWGPEIFGYVLESGDDLTFDTRDSAPYLPKCVVGEPAAARHSSPRGCRVPWDDTILYELHVKGYTKLHPAVPEHLRGTYAGLGHPAVVDYVRSLGVTSVELLPVQSFVDEPHLRELKLTNFWGYNTIGFFAPEQRYAADPRSAFEEFRAMVARYHDAGLEVILDVVYNHTAEGNECGPTLSLKGIDNRSYYRLQAANNRYYVNDTGTGNTVNVSHPRVLQMICDSLRYWVEQAHVDGFRFDLGTILAREPHGFDQGAGFLKVVAQDPVLNRVKLIAEPWDIGPGGYRVGQFPAGWMEWNDTFRDRTRCFWTGRGSAQELAEALAGSPSIFNHNGRRTWASVNFITAHDGFTLHDLVSYDEKHNLANGEDNRDGSNGNNSWNCGAEGPTDDPIVLERRDRQMRNLLSTLLLAQGTPMLLAGDEFARTQGGNNNAYCQDNAISWVDWTLCDRNADLVQFTRALIGLRRRLPLLRSSRFLSAATGECAWIAPDGNVVPIESTGAWARCFGLQLGSRTNAPGEGACLLLIVNGSSGPLAFSMPELREGMTWQPVISTDAQECQSSSDDTTAWPVSSGSLLLFQSVADEGGTLRLQDAEADCVIA